MQTECRIILKAKFSKSFLQLNIEYGIKLQVRPPPSRWQSHGEIMSKPKLLDQVRAVMRLKHLSLATEHAYVQWIKRYIIFHKMRHPLEMGATEIREFLTHLALKLEVASSTQNQALYALLFLYSQVLHKDIGPVDQIERAKRSKRLPEVFTPEEARRVIAQLHGTNRLIASLLYGSGLRLMECLRLRVKDLDNDVATLVA
jgi:integrase